MSTWAGENSTKSGSAPRKKRDGKVMRHRAFVHGFRRCPAAAAALGVVGNSKDEGSSSRRRRGSGTAASVQTSSGQIPAPRSAGARLAEFLPRHGSAGV